MLTLGVANAKPWLTWLICAMGLMNQFQVAYGRFIISVAAFKTRLGLLVVGVSTCGVKPSGSSRPPRNDEPAVCNLELVHETHCADEPG